MNFGSDPNIFWITVIGHVPSDSDSSASRRTGPLCTVCQRLYWYNDQSPTHAPSHACNDTVPISMAYGTVMHSTECRLIIAFHRPSVRYST